MTKIERVLRDLSEMLKFQRKIEEIKKANAARLSRSNASSAAERPDSRSSK